MSKYKKNYGKNRGGGHQKKSAIERDEIATLEARIIEEAPARGYAPPLDQRVAFRALPISDATLKGLESHKTKKFTTMTAIQNACVPHALAGRDVLGAARTGSGKTLAFLIPLVERLYRKRFTPMDGPGGIVLSPTRELAVQIFEVLRSVGSYHDFSAGLIVGGKKEFGLEQGRIGQTNIIIATPGRLLQHLEQTPDFDVSALAMLVLDEADRILDMGFREQMIRILDYLPPGTKRGGDRQTLLFSATQTKKVSDLAALSLNKPEYVGVHDKESTATPESLQQNMIVVPLNHKLDAIFSFIKSHLKKKTIIFFSSCSQVRFVWEVFCAMQPGIPLMALHGKIKQENRTKIYFQFLQRPHAVMFATDVAARGLDFPDVDWVVQADAPEDKEMYIHRVGRTARYNAGGKSLLVLLPSEQQAMGQILEEGKIPVKKLSVNPAKTVQVSRKISSIVAANPKLNDLGKKAFKAYLRSVHLMPNKDVFNVHDLPLDDFATSLGLASTPGVRFLKKIKTRDELRDKKNVNHKLQKLKDQIKAERLQKKLQKMGDKMAAETMLEGGKSQSSSKKRQAESDDDEDGLLVVKKKHRWGEDNDGGDDNGLPDIDLHEVSKPRHPKKIRIDGSSSGTNKKIVFNDDGDEDEDADMLKDNTAELSSFEKEKFDNIASANDEYVERIRRRLGQTKEQDKAEEKERVRQKHKKKRLKEKGDRDDEEDEGGAAMLVTLGGASDGEEEEVVGSSGSESSSGSEDSDSDSDDDDSDMDVKGAEDLALAMIRNSA